MVVLPPPRWKHHPHLHTQVQTLFTKVFKTFLLYNQHYYGGYQRALLLKFIIHGNFSTFSFVMNCGHYFIKITFTYIYRTKNKRQPHKVNLLGIFFVIGDFSLKMNAHINSFIGLQCYNIINLNRFNGHHSVI